MTDERRYDVIFRGDIAAGETLATVKERVGKLLNLDAPMLAPLFSGRPVVIRRSLESGAANHYCQVLRQAGALVELRAASSVAAVAVSPATPASAVGLAPVGADLLRPGERQVVPPLELSLGHLSLAERGSDIIAPEDRREVSRLELDLAHLSLEPPVRSPGASFSHSPSQ